MSEIFFTKAQVEDCTVGLLLELPLRITSPSSCAATYANGEFFVDFCRTPRRNCIAWPRACKLVFWQFCFCLKKPESETSLSTDRIPLRILSFLFELCVEEVCILPLKQKRQCDFPENPSKLLSSDRQDISLVGGSKAPWSLCFEGCPVFCQVADDPQDAIVAGQFKSNRSLFDLTARYWANVYAHSPHAVPEMASKVAQLVSMGFNENDARDTLSWTGWDITRASEKLAP